MLLPLQNGIDLIAHEVAVRPGLLAQGIAGHAESAAGIARHMTDQVAREGTTTATEASGLRELPESDVIGPAALPKQAADDPVASLTMVAVMKGAANLTVAAMSPAAIELREVTSVDPDDPVKVLNLEDLVHVQGPLLAPELSRGVVPRILRAVETAADEPICRLLDRKVGSWVA